MSHVLIKITQIVIIAMCFVQRCLKLFEKMFKRFEGFTKSRTHKKLSIADVILKQSSGIFTHNFQLIFNFQLTFITFNGSTTPVFSCC